jgi:hypothetical protein
MSIAEIAPEWKPLHIRSAFTSFVMSWLRPILLTLTKVMLLFFPLTARRSSEGETVRPRILIPLKAGEHQHRMKSKIYFPDV